MQQVDTQQIEQSLRLLVEPGATFEIRALEKRDTLYGYFRDPAVAAKSIAKACGNAIGVYVTMNPAQPALYSRIRDRIERATQKSSTTNDTHILRRRRLLIDIDGAPVAGVSTSDLEHEAALSLASEIRHELTDRGWPEPIPSDSGNGAHLIYGIDLPVESNLVELFLAAAQRRWGCTVDGITLKVDTTNKNPSRIAKVPGTWTRKGDNDPERPHRMARLLSAPEKLGTVTEQQLQSFIAEFGKVETKRESNQQSRTSTSAPRTLDVAEWLARHGLAVRNVNSNWVGTQGPGTCFELEECPFNGDHRRGEAHVEQHASGAITAGCHHESCKWEWKDLKERYQPAAKSSWSPSIVDAPPPPSGFERPRHDRIHDDAPPYDPDDDERAEQPKDHAGPAEDPWKAELKRALVDVQHALGSASTSERTPLFFDVRALYDKEYEATPWLVTGLITRGGVAQFGAEPKAGKTWLLLESVVGIVTGTKACGEFFAQQGVVAYFFAEDLDRQIRNRTRALCAGRGISPEALFGRLHVCPRGKTLDITKDADLAWVLASARRLGKLDLLALDPLRDVHSGKENESDDMSNVMRRMKTLGTLLDCTIAFSHHAGKPTKDNADRRPGQRSRGSGAIHGSTDSGIYFGRRGGDGVKTFDLLVEVEIKGAGGAGRFKLRLDVEDDEKGEATKAIWTHSKYTSESAEPSTDGSEAKPLSSADQMLANQLFIWIRDLAIRGEKLSRNGLREHDERPAGVPHRKIYPLIDWLITRRRLALEKGIVVIPEPPSETRDS